MKRLALVFAALTFSAAMMAQAPSSTGNAQTAATVKKATDYIKFKTMVYDFGKIKQGVPVTCEFGFTNISDKPLVIESATASCGCTTPIKPEAPIGAGKSDKITAGYNAGNLGTFTKSIYVKLAGIDAPVEIKITGNVLTADEYSKLDQSKKG